MDRLKSQIEEEIARRGPMTFARFMELALYAPGLGYYERQREIGRRGDFYTSVSAGSLFGEMLAFQFAQWLGGAPEGGRLQIVEAGPHQGALAADILRWLEQRRPDIFSRLDYWLVEPSSTRRKWQEETLRDRLSKIRWAVDIDETAAPQAHSIIFSNELLDAMPVHRLSWNAADKKWEEVFVASERGALVWRRSAPSVEFPLPDRELAGVLPNGYIVEHCPSAIAWWKKTAATLGQGKLVTIDYGLTASELLRPERTGGTLRTYSRHHPGDSPLDDPGECDITAHVHFSAIEAVGHAAGLSTEMLVEQGKFLTQILAQTEAQPGSFEPWTPTRTRQFQTLTHPEHLGHHFRVLIQSRTG